MALLLPDPCDPHCPEEFRRAAVPAIEAFASYVTCTKTGSHRLIADLEKDLRGRDQTKKRAARHEADRRNSAWQGFADTEDWTPAWIRSALLQLVASGGVVGLLRRRNISDDCSQPR